MNHRMYHCPGLTAVPEDFFENAGRLLKVKDRKELAEILHTLIYAIRKFILERKPEPVREEVERADSFSADNLERVLCGESFTINKGGGTSLYGGSPFI
nr:hypothetical protein [uncultured Acetatifactor sp.]